MTLPLTNNNGLFAQTVTDERKVLFIGASASDVAAGRNIYGDNDVTYITDVAQIPLTVEKMCGYDEIVLSNFDVRTLNQAQCFDKSFNACKYLRQDFDDLRKHLHSGNLR